MNNNSANGKTVENLRRIINVRLVKNAKDYLKYVSKPTFISQKIFNKKFANIHESKPVLVLNKPIYVGFTVLELTRYLMYDFHYNFIKKQFDANFLFTDTDSLTYEIKSEDVYKESFKNKRILDFSEYRPNFFNSTNHKVIGKMKDELKGISINKFVRFKPKMYSIISEEGKEVSTAKGVYTPIEFKKYEDIPFNKKTMRHKIKKNSKQTT